MKRAIFVIVVVLLVFSFLFAWMYILYANTVQDYNDLTVDYNLLVDDFNELSASYSTFQEDVFCSAEENHTAVTIVYYTNFSLNQQFITLSVPQESYNASRHKVHPRWDRNTLGNGKNYITVDDPIIQQIVETVESQTQSREELANALLDFVQDKGHGLSIRYYPTNELKYPIETLVEMGGDCDTHAFLYGTLMKAAGFKVLILLSNEKVDGQYHVATAVHLENPPENSLPDYHDLVYTYNGEKYYYAETTSWNWRVGDVPPNFENFSFFLLSI